MTNSGGHEPLPPGWSSLIASGTQSLHWTLIQPGALGLVNQGETQLYTPLLTVGSYPVELSFEYTNGPSSAMAGSGMVLEVSRNGGLFQDFRAYGNFLEGSYDASVDSSTNSPLLDGALFRSVFRTFPSTVVGLSFRREHRGFCSFAGGLATAPETRRRCFGMCWLRTM